MLGEYRSGKCCSIIFKCCAIALIGCSLIACSDPKEANENNFQQALEQFYKNKPEVTEICLGWGSSVVKYPYDVDYMPANAVQYSSTEMGLAAAGLITKIKEKSLYEKVFVTYDLTPKGKEIYEPENGFCYQANYSIEIKNFTVEQSNKGVSVSLVDYVGKSTEAPDWAVQAAKELKKIGGLPFGPNSEYFYNSVNSIPKNKRALIMLTNNGWQVERAFDK